jgi:hypothetical protein
MKNLMRFCILLVFLFGFTAVSYGQKVGSADDRDASAVAASSPSYVFVAPRNVNLSAPTSVSINSSMILKFPAGATSSRGIFAASNNSAVNASGNGRGAAPKSSSQSGAEGQRPDVSTIDGLDSVATFSGAFINQAGPSTGSLFRFIFMGNHPSAGGTTVIPAQITTVNLQLLNPDGSLRVSMPFTFRDLVEDSPNFAKTDYRSGKKLQYSDAVHRAQFFNTMGDDWHTVLDPHYVNDVTFAIPRFVNVQLPDGSIVPVQAYRVGTAPDGNHFVLMLDLVFNFFYENQVISDISAGNFTTNALSMTLFPNTYLFSIDDKGQLSNCCVLGFHTYFLDPNAIPQPRFVTQYASWISPGLFGPGFQDVTALSHETAEAFADPFLNNRTASWQFPGVPANAKVCQSNLEEGDPIEVLPVATIPLQVKERNEVFTYHPQIIPLLQWFEMGATSNAIDGAFSFPDETALPHSALPCPQ